MIVRVSVLQFNNNKKMEVVKENSEVSHRTCLTQETNFMDIIYRDQRTTKTYLREMKSVTDCYKCSKNNNTSTLNSCGCAKRNNKFDLKCDTRRNSSRQSHHHTSNIKISTSTRSKCNFLQRVARIIAIGVCLVNTVRLPVALSASVNRRSMDRDMNSRPIWMDPCGINSNEDATYEPLPESQLINNIILQANIANEHAISFRNEFVKEHFGTTFEKYSEEWEGSQYEWLPNIPKSLGKDVPMEHLQTLEFRSTLLESYNSLQKIAVGIEQVIWDMKSEGSKFDKYFSDANMHLCSVLCEIETAIIELGLQKPADVTREIMPQENRMMSNKTYRNVRDWVIYRHYMKALEYIIQDFEFFKNHL